MCSVRVAVACMCRFIKQLYSNAKSVCIVLHVHARGEFVDVDVRSLCACVCVYTSNKDLLFHVHPNDGCRAECTLFPINGGARDGLHACGSRSRVRTGRVVAARHLSTGTLQLP